MKLILTRHGETIENEQGIIQGHLPGTLSKKGIEQAKKLANRLKDQKIDVIYSSDLARAADTAKEIAKFHPNTPIFFVHELRERYVAEFQGKKKSELGLSKERRIAYLNSKEVETWEHMIERARKLLHETLLKHKDSIVLFVAHNGIGKAIVCAIKDKPAEETRSIENLGNTSITIFEIDEDKKHKIHLFNCTNHLV